MDLFNYAETYPHKPGFKEGGAARDAARLASKTSDSLQDRALALLLRAGAGMTVGDFLDLGFERCAIAPRLTELCILGKVRKTGRRKHHSSPISLTVYEAIR